MGSQDRSGTVATMLEAARSHLDVDVVFVAEFVGDERHLRHVAAASDDDLALQGRVDPTSESLCLRICDGRVPRTVADASATPETDLAVVEELGIKAFAGAPIVLPGGRVFGTVCGFNREAGKAIADDQVRALELLAALIGERINAESAVDAERRNLVAEVDVAAASVEIALQPIVALDRQTDLGYEALARFPGTQRNTGEWFALAAKVGATARLELAALRAALARLPELPPHTYLSVNLSADVLLDTDAPQLLLANQPHRIVLELTEQELSRDDAVLEEVLLRLRRSGLKLALDDLGAGHTSLARVLRLSPDIVKIDRELIRGIDTDPIRRAMLVAVAEFASSARSTLVAEGVETPGELACLRQMGIGTVQGFLLGQPDEVPWMRAQMLMGRR